MNSLLKSYDQLKVVTVLVSYHLFYLVVILINYGIVVFAIFMVLQHPPISSFEQSVVRPTNLMFFYVMENI